MKKEKPSVVVAEVGLDYVYVSNSEVGKIDSAFKHNTDIPWVVEMQDAIKQLKNDRARDNQVLEATLKAMGISTKNSRTNISLICSTLLGAKILLDNEKYVTLESVNGYIKAKAQGNLYKKAYVDLFPDLMNGCHKELEDGTIVLDEEKLAEMMAIL